MARTTVSSGSKFEELAGYARVVVDGPWIFVAGTTGFDYATMEIAEDAAEQTEQCFRNIAQAVENAGGSMSDMARIRIYIANRDDFEAICEVVGRHCRPIRPANTTVVCDLVDPRMKVEIEVTLYASER